MSASFQLGVPIAAALATSACALYIHRRRRTAPGAREYTVVLALEVAWILGWIAEVLATDLRQKLLWDDLQLLPCLALPVAYAVFALAYSGKGLERARKPLAILSLPLVAAFVFVVTDPIHRGARSTARLVGDPPFHALVYDFTAPEIVAFAVAFVLAVYVIAALLAHASRLGAPYRRQSFVVWAGVLIALQNYVTVFAMPIELLGQRDSAPLWFGLSSILVTYGLGRYRLFDVAPVARDAVFEHVDEAVFVLDARDRLVDENPAAGRVLGGAPRLGEAVAAAFAGWPGLLAAIEQGHERAEIRGPGDDRVFEVVVAALGPSGGDPPGDTSSRGARTLVLRDVTERRQAREELERRVAERTAELGTQIAATTDAKAAAEASERKLRAVFDGAFDRIAMLATDGTIVAANRAAHGAADAGDGFPVGRHARDLPWVAGGGEHRATFDGALERARAGEFVRYETEHRAADGELRATDLSLTPVRDPSGAVVSVVLEGRDVTDRRRAEAERAALEARLQASQRLEAIGRLAGGVAHDFNNLLTVILGNAQLAKLRAEDAERVRGYVAGIEQAATSASGLTRQLLAFSRQNVGEARVVDLNETATRLAPLLGRLLGEDVRLELELDPAAASVRLDPTYAEQILVNLAVNARDAMPSGGRVLVRTERVTRARPGGEGSGEAHAAPFVALVVRDEGVGMSEDVLARIFEPFFTTKPKGAGTGLGLAMVYGAAQQVGGFVEVDSAPGAGSTFGVYLPVAEPASRPEAIEPGASPSRRGGERVVLVEDDRLVRETITRQLETLGYRVQAFAGAEAALSSLPRVLDAIDLVITDVVLAGTSGRTLAEALWALRPALQVVFISGYTDDVVLRHGIERGAVFLLEKPFTIAQLGEMVRRALDAPPRGLASRPLTA